MDMMPRYYHQILWFNLQILIATFSQVTTRIPLWVAGNLFPFRILAMYLLHIYSAFLIGVKEMYLFFLKMMHRYVDFVEKQVVIHISHFC